MNKLTQILTIALLLTTQHVSAAFISFNPSGTSANVGDLISVDVVINDLQTPVANELSAFAFSVLFDASILAFDSVSYSSLLGDTDIFSGETFINTSSGISNVTLENTSFLSDLELDALQDPDFLLASITFSTLSVGTSNLTFENLDFADGLFFDITSSISTNNGLIEVASANVPAPAFPILLLTGLLAFGLKNKS